MQQKCTAGKEAMEKTPCCFAMVSGQAAITDDFINRRPWWDCSVGAGEVHCVVMLPRAVLGMVQAMRMSSGLLSPLL